MTHEAEHETEHDPARDPVLAAALRDLGPEPPMEAVDWERLGAAVAARAREHLAAREHSVAGAREHSANGAREHSASQQSGTPWWQPIATWARPAIPLALAAGIALALVVLRLPAQPVEPAETLLLGGELAESVYHGDAESLLRAAFVQQEPTP